MTSPSITELIHSRARTRTQISWSLRSVFFSHSKLTDQAKSVPKVHRMLIRFLQTQMWSKLWSFWNILNLSSFSSSAWVKAHSSCQRRIAEFLCFEFLCIRNHRNYWQAVGLHVHFKNQRFALDSYIRKLEWYFCIIQSSLEWIRNKNLYLSIQAETGGLLVLLDFIFWHIA